MLCNLSTEDLADDPARLHAGSVEDSTGAGSAAFAWTRFCSVEQEIYGYRVCWI